MPACGVFFIVKKLLHLLVDQPLDVSPASFLQSPLELSSVLLYLIVCLTQGLDASF